MVALECSLSRRLYNISEAEAYYREEAGRIALKLSFKVVRELLVFRNTRYTYEHAQEHEITLPYCICLLQTTHVSRCDHVRDKGPDKDARGRISMANEGPNGPGVCGMHAGGRSRDLRAQTHTQAAARMCTIVGATAHRAIRQKDGHNVVGVKWKGDFGKHPFHHDHAIERVQLFDDFLQALRAPRVKRECMRGIVTLFGWKGGAQRLDIAPNGLKTSGHRHGSHTLRACAASVVQSRNHDEDCAAT